MASPNSKITQDAVAHGNTVTAGRFSVDDMLASPWSSGLHGSFVPAASLEGGANSPPVTPDPNDPGLQAIPNSTKGFTMSSTWKWIIGIVLALLALWYFFGKPSTAAA